MQEKDEQFQATFEMVDLSQHFGKTFTFSKGGIKSFIRKLFIQTDF